MKVWIINPFDELPGDTDVRHRYWALAETLAGQAHEVTWWSSDFSHRTKSYRPSGTKDEGRRTKDHTNQPAESRPPSLVLRPSSFVLRLIHTSPYRRNVSLARLRNHRQFARRFLAEAVRSAEREGPPDRMVVSLPPLGTAEAAFALRARFGGEVILDIMDAWPETFYRLFPRSVPPWLRESILYPLHRAATRAIRGADRVSAVSQIYIDLAVTKDKGLRTKDRYHLCYHGIDLEDEGLRTNDKGPSSLVLSPSSLVPLKIAYIGALERSYDLETAIRAVHQLNTDGRKLELHIAGAGTQEPCLRSLADSLCASVSPCLREIQFHGNLNRSALHALLASCQLGLIPMRQDSWVGLPYKLADYCAAGLPVISSLDGECRRLLDTKKAGSFYEPGSVESLVATVRAYLTDPELITQTSANARRLAEECFDRSTSYPALAAFISGG